MKSKLLLLLILTGTLGWAQDFRKTATAGFVFLQLPVTARSAALAEASVTLPDMNSAAVFSNPAGLGFTQQTHSFSASYSNWFADIKHYAASYSFNSAMGVFGVGLVALDFGTMARTRRVTGQKVYEITGDFSSSAMALSLSYSRMLTDKFSFGVSVKYAREAIDIYSATNILFDGGVMYYTGFRSLRIGASIQNFGVETKYINDPFKMPSVLKLGLASEIVGDMSSEYRVTALVEALHPNDGDEKVNTGIEMSWKNIVTLRGGYKFFYDEDTYSFGVGLNPNLSVPLQLDFAFANYGRLGNILRFSLNIGYN
ncbi:MAG: PorV/PorQ family protein [Ignavibacteriaceae bacterium]|nr:PorV/PorQ family protein [Ignavibacteriaceae bacterium]